MGIATHSSGLVFVPVGALRGVTMCEMTRLVQPGWECLNLKGKTALAKAVPILLPNTIPSSSSEHPLSPERVPSLKTKPQFHSQMLSDCPIPRVTFLLWPNTAPRFLL